MHAHAILCVAAEDKNPTIFSPKKKKKEIYQNKSNKCFKTCFPTKKQANKNVKHRRKNVQAMHAHAILCEQKKSVSKTIRKTKRIKKQCQATLS